MHNKQITLEEAYRIIDNLTPVEIGGTFGTSIRNRPIWSRLYNLKSVENQEQAGVEGWRDADVESMTEEELEKMEMRNAADFWDIFDVKTEGYNLKEVGNGRRNRIQTPII